MNEKKVKITIILGVLFGLFIIWAVGSSYIYKLRKETFKVKVPQTLSIYGSQIEDVYVEGLYVCVYVNAAGYKNADKSVQEAWKKEVVTLIRMDAIETELLKNGYITVSFYAGKGSTERLGLYQIEE